MRMGRMLALTGCVVLVSTGSFAQKMSDADYCNKLSSTYRTIVGSNAAAAGNVPEAMAGCASNPAGSIPTLEKALLENKVDLPKR